MPDAYHPYRRPPKPPRAPWDLRRLRLVTAAAFVVAIGLACGMFVRSEGPTRHRFRSHTICSIIREAGTRFDRDLLERIARADDLAVDARDEGAPGEIVATVFRHTSLFGGYGCRLEFKNGALRRKSVYWVDG